MLCFSVCLPWPFGQIPQKRTNSTLTCVTFYIPFPQATRSLSLVKLMLEWDVIQKSGREYLRNMVLETAMTNAWSLAVGVQCWAATRHHKHQIPAKWQLGRIPSQYNGTSLAISILASSPAWPERRPTYRSDAQRWVPHWPPPRWL